MRCLHLDLCNCLKFSFSDWKCIPHRRNRHKTIIICWKWWCSLLKLLHKHPAISSWQSVLHTCKCLWFLDQIHIHLQCRNQLDQSWRIWASRWWEFSYLSLRIFVLQIQWFPIEFLAGKMFCFRNSQGNHQHHNRPSTHFYLKPK